MDPIARFAEYAAAFERVYASDDWSQLEPYFTEDAEYLMVGSQAFAGRHSGRDAAFAALKRSVDSLDRRFQKREVQLLEGPALVEGAVWFRWRASYRSEGVPELVIDGEERVEFEGDRIRRLTDRFPLETGSIFEHWMSHYANRLPPAPA